MITGRVRRLPLLLPIAVVASLALAVPEAQAAPRCFGKPATIVGTSGKDQLLGSSQRDVIVGRGGNDLIVGRGGNDLLCGNGGKDEVFGVDDADDVSGGSGNDTVAGGVGGDQVKGDGGHDLVYGGKSKDTLRGGGGDDLLFGNESNDKLLGAGGFDVLLGLENSDTLKGGAGVDTASFFFSKNQEGITADLDAGVATGEGTDTLVSIEGLEASGKVSGDDQWTGKAGVNWFWPYGGNDNVNGSTGFDIVSYFNAPNPMDIDLDTNTAMGDGSDTVLDIEGAFGGPQGDQITGTTGHNHLFGLAGNDSIDALGGDDYLHGGKGLSDDGDGGDGTDGCVAIENETSCELDTHPTAAARSAPHGRVAPVAGGAASVAAPKGS
jgi:RTX calcium-binding nonapeptide repeat (4 copies)